MLFFSADPLKLCQVRWALWVDSHFQISPEMFDWVQVRALAGPLKDIQGVVPKPLLRCLGCMLKVIVLLEGEPLAQCEALSTLDPVLLRISLYFAPFSFPSTVTSPPSPCRWKTPPQHDSATTVFHHVMSGAWFLPDMMLRIEARQLNLGFVRPENLVSHSLGVL